jgi:RHS repeat-associated protein
MPSSQYSKRFMLYDGSGHTYFNSEWVADSVSESLTAGLGTSCAFSTGSFTTSQPSSAPGTYRLCYDPFGRPQQAVGSSDSSLVTVNRTDGAVWYSDTLEATTVACVNGTLQTSGACGSGGVNATTTNRKDAWGRLTSVTEPSTDVNSYSYDVNGKLTTVSQGVQSRTFSFDTAGFLRSETTPERGTVTYNDYGSLGNLRQRTENDGTVVSYLYDFAGRLACEGQGLVTTGSGPCPVNQSIPTLYIQSYYDGNGFAGGDRPLGKLTRSVSNNPLFAAVYPTTPASPQTVIEDFAYSGIGGRLSSRTTHLPSGANDGATEIWTYNALGLPAVHSHPRTAGGLLQESISYASGLATGISVAGLNFDGSSIPGATISATYGPSGGLASYTAAQGASSVTTTIALDPSGLPRPARISTSSGGFDTGLFGYDGAGNVLAMNRDSNNVDAFAYDSRSRATLGTYKVGGVTSSQTMSYDRWGNLLAIGGTGARSFCSASCGNNQLPPPAAYDARGNLTAYGVDTVSYDQLNRQVQNLSSVSGTWQYVYDAAGERVVRATGATASSLVPRRDVARYLTQASGWTPTTTPCVAGSEHFADVKCADGDWAVIQTLYEHGITTGCDPTHFCPESIVFRAQLAIFLARARNGGDGVPISGYANGYFFNCVANGTSVFADVNPTDVYCKHVHYLYANNVTTGCSGSPGNVPNNFNFCPSSNNFELQLQIFLSRMGAPWTSYHPIQQGSLYTLRDEEDRLLTEFSDSFPLRDNIWLGNVVVASYLSSTPSIAGGWQFHSSDHLGTVRQTLNVPTGTFESHKYWPFGDEYNAGVPSAQRLSFASMERDPETSRFYDHARTQDFNLGRFLSPDKVGGRVKDPQTWNRYTYARNNPVKLVDPNGKYFVLANEADRARFVSALSAVSMDSRGRAVIERLAADKRPVLLQNVRIESPENVGAGRHTLGDTTPHGPFTTPGERGPLAQSATVSVDFQKIADVTTANPGSSGLTHLDSQGIAVTGHELAHAYAGFYEGIGAALAQDERGSSAVGPAELFGAEVTFFPNDPSKGLSEQQINDLIQKPPADVCGVTKVCVPPQN